jgi:hypothetical protein
VEDLLPYGGARPLLDPGDDLPVDAQEEETEDRGSEELEEHG